MYGSVGVGGVVLHKFVHCIRSSMKQAVESLHMAVHEANDGKYLRKLLDRTSTQTERTFRMLDTRLARLRC